MLYVSNVALYVPEPISGDSHMPIKGDKEGSIPEGTIIFCVGAAKREEFYCCSERQ